MEDKDVREAVLAAILSYREAWVACATEYREGVLPSTISGEDTPEAWESYELDKRLTRAESVLIAVLTAHGDTYSSVRYQGIAYSLQKNTRFDHKTDSFYSLVQRRDTALDLDWPEGTARPSLPSGPKSWDI